MCNEDVQNNTIIPNRILRLKFGTKEHVENLYRNGELYFNTFKYFKELEENGDGRADKREYIENYYAGTGLDTIEFSLNGHKLSKEGGLCSLEMDYSGTKKYTHLYCMSYIDVHKTLETDLIIDERNFADGKDYVVIIHNVVEFKKRLLNKINKIQLCCQEGYIEYFDPLNYGGKVGCFRKTNDYEYQNEWRIAANFGNDKENIPQIINIGSLEDIAFPPVNKIEFYKQKLQIGERVITNNKVLKQNKELV